VSFLREVCGLDLGEDLNARASAYEETAASACWWWPHREFVMVCDRPLAIERDADGRLHNSTGASVLFRDGRGVHAWHGVLVDSQIIEHPELITIEQIEACTNAEIRRVLIERYGADRYLMHSGAQVLHRDRFGALYRKEIEGDEPLVMVRVLNATPEHDGSMTRDEALAAFPDSYALSSSGSMSPLRSMPAAARFKEYFLRVSPECRPLLTDNQLGEPQELTARNAVASTFWMRGEEYEPALES
jgi:hypothetical protein